MEGHDQQSISIIKTALDALEDGKHVKAYLLMLGLVKFIEGLEK